MPLIGSVYVEDSHADPGAVGFGYKWYKSDTGDVVIRNTSNTGWILQGNANQTYLGALNRGGGIMTGAILGKHGIVSLAGGNFTTAPTISMATVAVTSYVDERDNDVLDQIQPQVKVGVASIPGVSVNSNFAVVQPTIQFTPGSFTGIVSITGASYGDGTPVDENDVTIFFSTSAAGWPFNNMEQALAYYIYQVPQPPPSYSVYSATYSDQTSSFYDAFFVTIGFAIKPAP